MREKHNHHVLADSTSKFHSSTSKDPSSTTRDSPSTGDRQTGPPPLDHQPPLQSPSSSESIRPSHLQTGDSPSTQHHSPSTPTSALSSLHLRTGKISMDNPDANANNSDCELVSENEVVSKAKLPTRANKKSDDGFIVKMTIPKLWEFNP
ncbi:hypothetical protein L1987_71445 [Smallanthus sonchifolius]|uniref:Uncharacterized protein n=1 Tax=Smallanthus sonchifolius TaxID=185202 RepID=A0ACB9ARV0_9ASTR|nr:hypothetical protein L1987_71445 [Smallanthus sonchifolius]